MNGSGSFQPFAFSVLIAIAVAFLWPQKIVYIFVAVWTILAFLLGRFYSIRIGWAIALLVPLLIVVLLCLGDINRRLK